MEHRHELLEAKRTKQIIHDYEHFHEDGDFTDWLRTAHPDLYYRVDAVFAYRARSVAESLPKDYTPPKPPRPKLTPEERQAKFDRYRQRALERDRIQAEDRMAAVRQKLDLVRQFREDLDAYDLDEDERDRYVKEFENDLLTPTEEYLMASRNSRYDLALSAHQFSSLPAPRRSELPQARPAVLRRAVRASAVREARHIRRRGCYMGTDTRDGYACYLAAKWLRTHVHVLGPTGTGKSRLLLWLFQLLCHTGRPIVLVDPKGGLFRMARDWALANGYSSRLVLFDLSSDVIPGYNPLRETGLRIDMQAQWVREGIKSAWGASTFDSTPLLARMLYLCLYVARAMSLSLMDALDVLRPMPTLRHRALKCIKDPFVHNPLAAFDHLSDRIKTEQSSSTVSRLEMFVCDEIVRTVICSKQSLRS